jgi:hypothetical protein
MAIMARGNGRAKVPQTGKDERAPRPRRQQARFFAASKNMIDKFDDKVANNHASADH